jgi:hypothetical protein
MVRGNTTPARWTICFRLGTSLEANPAESVRTLRCYYGVS